MMQNSSPMILRSYNFHASIVAKLPQETLTILPGQSKSSDVCYAKSSDDVTDSVVMSLIEVAVHHHGVRPYNEIIEGDLVP